MIPAGPNTPPAPVAAPGSAREWWAYAADGMVIAVVVCLPWSTAATVAMVIVWLLVVLPLNGPAVLRQSVWSGFGGIPILLWLAAALGMLWGDASWHNRPHNQIRAVALQLGLLGVGLLLAMWYAHLRLFTNAGLACTLGLIVVVQHVVGSLFNSHLFDFTQGFIYVFGVGVLGGMALREADLAKSTPAAHGP